MTGRTMSHSDVAEQSSQLHDHSHDDASCIHHPSRTGLDSVLSAYRVDRSETEWSVDVITAIVLIQATHDRIPEAAEALADLDGVSEVYSVAGRFDLVAIARVRHHEELAETVAGHIDKTRGVEKTETLIAFRAYSRHDLEAAFSLGLS